MTNQKQPLLERAGEIYGYLHSYVEDRIELLKLETAESTAKVLSSLITSAFLAVVVFFALFFGSIALAIALGNWLGSYSLAFGIVALFYLCIAALFYLFRKSLIASPILESIIKTLFE